MTEVIEDQTGSWSVPVGLQDHSDNDKFRRSSSYAAVALNLKFKLDPDNANDLVNELIYNA